MDRAPGQVPSLARAARAALLLVVLLLGSLLTALPGTTARAREAVAEATDPALEARMVHVASELRCLVCQNQTIADSHADLAVDLRKRIREQLSAGRSDSEIIDYMTARYGDFVLYRPPFKRTTALLWLGPALLLVGGLVALGVVLIRRNRLSVDAFDPDDGFDGDADTVGSGAPSNRHDPRHAGHA